MLVEYTQRVRIMENPDESNPSLDEITRGVIKYLEGKSEDPPIMEEEGVTGYYLRNGLCVALHLTQDSDTIDMFVFGDIKKIQDSAEAVSKKYGAIVSIDNFHSNFPYINPNPQHYVVFGGKLIDLSQDTGRENGNTRL